MAHNAVLVDGEGQRSHSAGLNGQHPGFRVCRPRMDYVVGSAAEAYGGRLERYRRCVAFVKPDLIVICDDLAATNEATFQFMLHAPRPLWWMKRPGARLSSSRRPGRPCNTSRPCR